MRRSGRKPAARSYDAMIAAVAIANDLPLFTCNPQDFQGIEELTIVGVPHAPDPRLEILACYGPYYTLVDLAAAKERGVVISHTPDSTAETQKAWPDASGARPKKME